MYHMLHVMDHFECRQADFNVQSSTNKVEKTWNMQEWFQRDTDQIAVSMMLFSGYMLLIMR